MKSLLGAATALLVVGFAAPSFAAATASDSSTVTAKIIRPISVTKNADLAFGTIVRPTVGGGSSVVAVDTAGSRSVTGGDAVALGTTTAAAAQFTIAGEGGQSISVTVPATFDLGGPGTVTVTTTNDMSGSAASQLLNGSLGGGGSLVVKVGGSFTVTDSTATGDYTGTLTVSSSYN